MRALLTLTLLPALAFGQLGPDPDPRPTPHRASISGHFKLIKGALDRWGRHAPIFGPEGLPPGVRLDAVGATLRFTRPLTEAERGQIEGVTFNGPPVGAVYTATVEWSALGALRGHPLLLRVEPTWRPLRLAPLEVTSVEAGAEAVRRRVLDGTGGEGVVVGTLDSGVDVLHPHFFKADGGAYAWVDVNGDGLLSPELDGVDLDGDGAIGEDERLLVLDGTYVNFYDPAQEVHNEDRRLQPELDWVFIDVNQNGRRDAGRDAGFTEQDLAYGEPLFVADDADRDGQIRIDERLIRLGNSKIMRINYGGRTYYRGGFAGLPLIRAVEDEEHAQSMHGTGVASILLGGQAPYHDRIGLAPEAELITFTAPAMDTYMGYQSTISYLDACLNADATLLLHEWTDPFTAAHDGSSNLEVAMAEARLEGLSQVTPLGNMNTAQKHKQAEIYAGEAVEWRLMIDEGFNTGWGVEPYTIVFGSLMWRADQPNLSITIVDPNGIEAALELDPSFEGVNLDDDTFISASFDLTPGGTRHLFFYIQDLPERGLEEGEWVVRLEGVEADDLLFGRIADYYSSWSVGVRWIDATEGISTLTFPATADGAIGVAAYGGRHGLPGWEETGPGQLRDYSGRGPRFDGAPAVDIAAPDDPYAALSATPDYLAAGMGPAWFMTFGGTSGAGPHVAAALVLLRAQFPEETAEALEARLYEAAREGPEAPDEIIGHGKLDAHAAIYGEARPDAPNTPPEIVLEATLEDEQLIIDLTGSLDADGDPLAYRFDVGYDGEWEGGWSADGRLIRAAEGLDAVIPVRVAVSDSRSEVGAVETLRLEELRAPAEPDAAPPSPSEDAGVGPDPSTPDMSVQPGPGEWFDAGAGAGADADAEEDQNDDGCGCDLTPRSPTHALWLLALLALRPRRR